MELSTYATPLQSIHPIWHLSFWGATLSTHKNPFGATKSL